MAQGEENDIVKSCLYFVVLEDCLFENVLLVFSLIQMSQQTRVCLNCNLMPELQQNLVSAQMLPWFIGNPALFLGQVPRMHAGTLAAIDHRYLASQHSDDTSCRFNNQTVTCCDI